MQKNFYRIFFFFLFCAASLLAQISTLPYGEHFDTVTTPALPNGWTTSTVKSVQGDFSTSTSTVRSAPNTVISTDATKQQWLVSPQFNFSGKVLDSIEFYERRSASHTSAVLLEASINGDTSFSTTISDSMKLVSSTSFVKRIFALPQSLNNQSNVRFRWRIIGNGSGSSGTYRVDDIFLTAKKSVDLALSSINVIPLQPKKGETLTLSLGITNKALSGSFTITLQLFDSLKAISTVDSSLTITAGDSAILNILYTNISAGRHPLTVTMKLQNDEDTTNNSLSTIIFVGYQPRMILINEIQYAPPSGMPEWIECVNNSDTTLSLSDWKISDAGANKAPLLPAGRIIPKQTYFIVTTDTSALKTFYTISVPLFQASFSALNNSSSDAVVLYGPYNTTIDSVFYSPSWGGSAGKSLERIDTALSSNLQANWKQSKHPQGATPGFINSWTQKNYDLEITNIIFHPTFPVSGNTISAEIQIKNIGKQPMTNAATKVYLDANKDSLHTESEKIDEKNISQLNPNDSTTVSITLPSLTQGIHQIIATVTALSDEDTSNNIIMSLLTIGISPQSIIINEIMYAPNGDMPEWIECYNKSASAINISQWKISDAGTTKALLSGGIATIPSQSYFVVTTDTAALKNYFQFSAPLFEAKFGTLNNTTPDAVVLYDDRGAQIDSIYYKPNWGGTNGNSLQRFDLLGSSVDSSNWRSTNPTPGKSNTFVRKNFDAAIKTISISPQNPLVNQQVSIIATIQNVGYQTVTAFSVEFYVDENGDSLIAQSEMRAQQSVAALAPLSSVEVSAQTVMKASGKQFVFVKIIFASDEATSNNIASFPVTVGVAPKSIVVSEIMYNPQNEIPEWIELYNTTSQTISLSGWKISDAGTTKGALVNTSASVAAHSYCIVTTDSSFLNYYVTSVPVYKAAFSTLNNTTPDAVVVFDNLNRTMDSVYYLPAWGGTNGNSLQRFDFFSPSTDSTNWISATPSPGMENAVGKKDYDVRISSVLTTKLSTGFSIDVAIRNIGRTTAKDVTLKLYADSNADSLAQNNEQFFSSTLDSLSADSSYVFTYHWNISSPGKHLFIVQADFTQDENNTNNAFFGFVNNSFPEKSLIINEILYEPSSGNPEFVELFNPGNDSLDISNWMLMDQPSSSGSRAKILLSPVSKFIRAKAFLTIATDSSIYLRFPLLLNQPNVLFNSSLNLSNSGEDLILVDLTGTQIDSVRYSPLWHLKNISTQNRSLERINPLGNSNDSRNWSSCVAPMLATPGSANSIYTASVAATTALTLSPNPFSPDNDGFEDFLTVSYALPTNSSIIRIRIYDVNGRLVRRLANSEPSASTGTIIWNGLDDDGVRVRIGMYIILFEALDNFGGIVRSLKDVAVVAGKL